MASRTEQIAKKNAASDTSNRVLVQMVRGKPRMFINGVLTREYPDLAYLMNDLRNRMYGQTFTLELDGVFITA